MVDSQTPLITNNHHQVTQKDENFELCSVSGSNREHFQMLIKKETNFVLIKNVKTSWFKRARLDIIKWILDTTTLLKFHSSTAYLSLVYFDRFFSRRTTEYDGDLCGVRILSVACLSLAAKMQESGIMKLSNYCIDGYYFDWKMVQEMELLVLSTLEWKMNCVTPFDYLHYFVNKFFEETGIYEEETIKQAVELILAVMGEINAAEQRPSTVAAAAILAAYDHRFTFEIKMNVVPLVDKELMFSCHKLMQEILHPKSKTPKSVESPNWLSTPPQSSVENFEFCLVSDSDCEHFEMLIKKETNFELIKNVKTSWFKSTRLDVIKWILDTSTRFKFHSSTAYLSLVYFDRFFSRRSTEHDGDFSGVRIISVACLSLAAKMQESGTVKLSNYRIDRYYFDERMVQEMEVLVFSTLEWKMNCFTPFDYIHYFVIKFFGKIGHEEEIISKVAELILAVMAEINAAEQRPSIIAAAAVLAAYNHRLTKIGLESKMNVVPLLQKELTSSCYKLMQNIVQAKSQNSLSKTPSSSNDILDDSIILGSRRAGGTRRRLDFGAGDQHCPLQKIRKNSNRHQHL